MNKIKRLWLFFGLLVMTGCATKPTIEPLRPYPVEQRAQHIAQLNNWQLTGKLAFISPEKRESANLFWQYDQAKQKQKLELTSYFGVNVLSLNSSNQQHQVEVDGQSYYGDDLDYLVYSLTGMILPTQALHHWLKGLPSSKSDQLIYDKNTHLPSQMTSYYNNLAWHISYDDYAIFGVHKLAKKITIKQNGLTIRIRINQWSI